MDVFKADVAIVGAGGAGLRAAIEASAAGARVIRHPYNKGNGAAVTKLGTTRAMSRVRPCRASQSEIAPAAMHPMSVATK